MARIPFSRELNDLFERDSNVWLKVLGGVFVGGFVGFAAIRWGLPDNDRGMPIFVGVAITVSSAVIAAIVVLALCLKDVVRQRLKDGKSVNIVLRAYLAAGLFSLLLWILTSVFGTIFVSAIVFSL